MSHVAFSGWFHVLSQSFQSTQSRPTLGDSTPWTVAHQASLSITNVWRPHSSIYVNVLIHQCVLTSRGERLTFIELHPLFPCNKAGVILQ